VLRRRRARGRDEGGRQLVPGPGGLMPNYYYYGYTGLTQPIRLMARK
jgi:hypothetical protein